MKRKTILSALFSAIVACFFVACSNDSDALDINASTRSAISSSYMTREDIQTRLDEIVEKYGTKVIFDNSVNKDSITEDVFMNLEEQLSAYKNNLNVKTSTNNESLLLDDSSIDDIVTMAAPPSGETYSGSFDVLIYGKGFPFTVYAVVTWHSSDSRGLTNVEVDVQMGEADYILITSYRQTGGTNSHPHFDYAGDVYRYDYGKIGSFTAIYDGTN